MPQGSEVLFEKTDINGEGKYIGEWVKYDIPTNTP